MSEGILIKGWGAVSPAGWGIQPLRELCETGQSSPDSLINHQGRPFPIPVRKVPAPSPRPAFLAHPRLRRSSPISVFLAAAALEAIGSELDWIQEGHGRLGIIFSAMTGCVSYSRRFYDEVLKDPSTASPIVFPETVFNAPSSHIATYLGTNAINYTLVGDSGTFVQGLALAAEWLLDGRVDSCLVVAAEELDWLVAGAQQLFDKGVTVSEGAGALLLERQASGSSGVQLDFVTQPSLYTQGISRARAISTVMQQVTQAGDYEALYDSLTGAARTDAPDHESVQTWPGDRISVKALCGESFAAGSAWQCALAVDSIAQGRFRNAAVCVAGCNEQAIGAGFSASATHSER